MQKIKLFSLFFVLFAASILLVAQDNTFSGPGPVILTNTRGVNMRQNVISGSGATRTLLAVESGALVLFDRAAGIVFTLPAPAAGRYFDFIVTTSITSNAGKISTATQGTDWILGTYTNFDIDSGIVAVGFTCNGTSHDNFSMNGTTTGGLLGTRFRLSAVSTTVWVISGTNEGNGTVATACSTT